MNKMKRLLGKVIVISGASSGIGRQCAILCNSLGAKLILIGRNEKMLQETIDLLGGKQNVVIIQDLLNIENLDANISSAVEEVGLIDGFIHAAGIQKTIPLRLHKEEDYTRQFTINAFAGFEICRIITNKAYFNLSGGSLVFIASIRGTLGSSNQIGYAASKGAVIAGTRSLAIELASRRIRVNTVSPGMVEDTEMTIRSLKRLPADWSEKSKSEYPLGWVSAKDAAFACAFLLSDESRMITGIDLVVDGGFSAK